MQDHPKPTAIEDVTALSDHELQQRISMSFLDGLDPDQLDALRAERIRRDNAAYRDGLRRLLAFLDANPDIPCMDTVASAYAGDGAGAVLGPRHLPQGKVTAEQFMAIVEAMDQAGEVTVKCTDNDRVQAWLRLGPVAFCVGASASTVAVEQRQVSRTEYVMPDALRQRMGEGAGLRSAA